MTDIKPIFSNCSCHSGGRGGLTFTANSAYSALVNKSNSSGKVYIKPADITNSYVVTRMDSSGNSMPPSGRLSAAVRQKLKDWICNGAKQ